MGVFIVANTFTQVQGLDCRGLTLLHRDDEIPGPSRSDSRLFLVRVKEDKNLRPNKISDLDLREEKLFGITDRLSFTIHLTVNVF